jgi:hypothetical protein
MLFYRTGNANGTGARTVIISLCVYTYLTLENRKPPAPDKKDTDKRVMETTPLVKP